MILDEKEIIDIIEKPRKGNLAVNKELQDDHKVHIYGAGFESVLTQIIGYENVEQFEQKKLLTKPFTRTLMKEIIDAQSRWKTSFGTSKFYEFKDKEQRKEFQDDVLSQVWKGKSMSSFVDTFLSKALYEEFNGFFMIDRGRIVMEDGVRYEIREGIKKILPEGKEPLPYIVFIAVEDVYSFKIIGDTVEYLAINYGTKKVNGNEVKLYRVLDDKYDYIVEVHGRKPRISTDYPPIEHGARACPVSSVTHLNHKLTNDETKTSPVDQIIDLLD